MYSRPLRPTSSRLSGHRAGAIAGAQPLPGWVCSPDTPRAPGVPGSELSCGHRAGARQPQNLTLGTLETTFGGYSSQPHPVCTQPSPPPPLCLIPALAGGPPCPTTRVLSLSSSPPRSCLFMSSRTPPPASFLSPLGFALSNPPYFSTTKGNPGTHPACKTHPRLLSPSLLSSLPPEPSLFVPSGPNLHHKKA